MIKLGMWLTNGHGVVMVTDIDTDFCKVKEVLLDDKGVAHYGKERTISTAELDRYEIV